MSHIRINPADHHLLKELAQAQGASLPDTLHLAIKALQRKTLLEEANAGYAALRTDPQAWAVEQAERSIWDRAEVNDAGGPAYDAGAPNAKKKAAAKPSKKKAKKP